MERSEPKIPFVNLHGHSVAGSLFDAIGYPQEHMDYAYQNGCNALALTDHGNMNGLSYQVLHAKKMKSDGKDFKPIYGVEAYFNPSIEEWQKAYEEDKENRKKKDEDNSLSVEDEAASKKAMWSILNRRRHLILLAQNEKGLENLFKLVSKSYTRPYFFKYPRVDYDLLKQHSEGVIAASACLGGVYAGCLWENREGGEEAVLNAMREVTEKMLDIFGDRWYGELQWNNVPEQHELNKYIIQMHKEYGIKLISTCDSHYPNPDAWRTREAYKRIGYIVKRWKKEIEEIPQHVDEIGYELYPKNGDQVWESYLKYTEECDVEYEDEIVHQSIKETYDIAHDRIDSFFPDNTVRLPDFVVPDGVTDDEALRELVFDGLRSVVGEDATPEYVDRIEHELTVLSKQKFSRYFLTMNMIKDVANDMGLNGPGRGSAAGSLVAYCLGITQVDPLKYGLLFSRFLRADSKDFPDIDFDVPRPMELKEKLIDMWGADCVAPISNWNTLQLKSLVKYVSKLYQVKYSEVDKVTKVMLFEATPAAKKAHGIKAGVYTPTWEEVMKYSPTLKSFLSNYPDVKIHILGLLGQRQSCSRHAGGVIISEDIPSRMPLIQSGGVIQTPWSEGQNVRHLEPMGFIKFDLLGLASLRMIEGCIRRILQRYHDIEEPTTEEIREYYDQTLHPDAVDFNDESVYKNIFREGKWGGIFQFTETGAQDLCKRVQPSNLIDISTITSIYRPGPLSAKVDLDYLEAKKDPESVKYIHPIHKEITEETYGFLIFQEQIALLAHKLGKDISLDEGNKLRKLFTKKGTGSKNDLKESLHLRFVTGCHEKGVSHHDANELWKTFEYFSGYGFNKSHAVAYSMIGFQCAWLMNYYPSEWMASFLDKDLSKDKDRRQKGINIAKSHGYDIKKPNVNESGMFWEVSKDDSNTLVQPLANIDGVGDKAIQELLVHRPFTVIEDLLFNEELDYRRVNKRVLDSLTRCGALNDLVDDRFNGLKHFWSTVAVDRVKTEKKFNENIELYSEEGEFTEEEMIEYEVRLTGLFPIDKIVSDDLLVAFSSFKIIPVSDYSTALENADDPEECPRGVWFVPLKKIEKKTSRGKLYWILEVIDSNSNMSRIKCWSIRETDILHVNRPYIVEGIDYSPQWGFSVRSAKAFKLVG